tara:strand:+ start:4262 stop:4435 length:174 start_codon:yes stop_codon:yes gene_type:complete
MNMEEEIIDAVNNLATQIRLLREDLRPELKKSAVLRRKKAENDSIKKDMQEYWRSQV